MHPYLERYFYVIQHNNYDKQEALAFLRMVRLKERKLGWAFKEKERKVNNREICLILGIKKRRFQKLYAEYKMTGKIPELNRNRRPKTYLNDEQKTLIDKAMISSNLRSAVLLRLYIKNIIRKIYLTIKSTVIYSKKELQKKMKRKRNREFTNCMKEIIVSL